MGAFAAVMTGRGVGAISSIAVFGDSAKEVLEKIFVPAGRQAVSFAVGRSYVGTINDEKGAVDQVTVGCEGPGRFAINCHGNPLIVEMIMQLLQQQGITLISTEELLEKISAEQVSGNAIAREAKLAHLRAQTLDGTRLIANQVEGGLSRVAADWLKNLDTISLDEIRSCAKEILERSETARFLIDGCKVVLIGPPNSGKSLLFNNLCGKEKAIVTEIAGTTRDWVSAECRIGRMLVELVDTAGVAEALAAAGGEADRAAQERSVKLLQEADLVLLVLDITKGEGQVDEKLAQMLSDKRVITVLNKCDLKNGTKSCFFSQKFSEISKISAKSGTNLDKIIEKVQKICGVEGFDVRSAVCFTERQKRLIERLAEAGSKGEAKGVIMELVGEGIYY
jgi:tRNA modification GTPase